MRWLLTFLVVCLATSAYATTTRLRLNDEINDESITPLLDGIDNAPHDKDDRIILEINSPGGEVDPGFKLVKAIERYPGKVICIVDGEADSMASYLFVSCDVRAMTKRSILMIHQPGMGGSGQANDMLNAADWLKASGTGLTEHYPLHMRGITAAELAVAVAKCGSTGTTPRSSAPSMLSLTAWEISNDRTCRRLCRSCRRPLRRIPSVAA